MLQPRFPPFDSLPHQTGSPVLLCYDPEQPDAVGAVPLPPDDVRVVTADTTVSPGDSILFVNSSAGDVVVTLPAATHRHAVQIHWRTAGGHELSVVPAGTDTIGGAASFEFAIESPSRTFRSDGATYWAVF